MGLFRRKSAWRRAVSSAGHRVPSVPSVLAPGLTALGGVVGLVAASSGISALRHRQESEDE